MTLSWPRNPRGWILLAAMLGLAADAVWVNVENIRMKRLLLVGADTYRPSLGAGEVAPSFELSSVEGRAFRLADYRGTPLTIIYFSPDCHECETQAARWRWLHESGDAKSNRVLGVVNAEPWAVRAFREEHGIAFPVLLDTAGAFARAYRIMSVPTVIRIDENGRIGGM